MAVTGYEEIREDSGNVEPALGRRQFFVDNLITDFTSSSATDIISVSVSAGFRSESYDRRLSRYLFTDQLRMES